LARILLLQESISRVMYLRLGRRCLGTAWAVAVAFAPPVSANTFAVSSTSDSGTGSLRAAIAGAANGDTINFNLSYPATITLNSTISFATSLTIRGPGASSLTISASTSPQAFSINGASVTISGITMGGRGGCCDGAISNFGTLTLSASVISGSPGSNSAGIANFGTLVLNGSTVSGFSGGGISNSSGRVILINSTVSGNVSTGGNGGGNGGGIDNFSGSLTVTNSTISGNSADYGGGIYNDSGTVTVTNGTIAGNAAVWAGGGIDNVSGTLTLIHTTVSGNSALGNGGGISSSGALKLKNTILAGNGPTGNCYAFPAVSSGHNLSDDNSCALNGPGDLNDTPAGLDPEGLNYNGGPTRTIALLPTSPAVDAVPVIPTNYCTEMDGATPVTVDQRGSVRPQGPACDIGAVELVTYPQTVSTVPAGLSIAVDGGTYTAPQTFNWAPGTAHAIATYPFQTSGGSTFQFINWSDAGALAHTVLTSAGAGSFTASFAPPVTVQTVRGDIPFAVDGVTYTSVQTFAWVPGTRHTLAASLQWLVDRTNYGFVNWSDGAVTPGQTITAPMSAGAYIATYTALTYVTVTTVPPGLSFTADGASYVSPQVFYWWPSSTHGLGTFARQSLAASSYTFSGWSDGLPLVQQVVVPASAAAYTATFVALNPSAVVSLSGPATPLAAGQAATFSVQVVSSTQFGTPTGTVQFGDAATKLGTVTLAQGQAAFTTTFVAAGAHLITASYSGDSSFTAGLANLTQTVNPIPATVSLTPSASATVFGQAIALTAQVGPQQSFAVPGGQVQVLEGTKVLATAVLSSGAASFQISTLGVGQHILTAQYTGDATWSATASGPLVQTVNQAATSITLTASPSADAALSAAVGVSIPGAGTPAGSVQFVDAATGAVLATAKLGTTAVGANLGAVAGHTVQAAYSGDTNFSASTSAALMVPAVANAASGASVVFAPDELASLFGTNLASGTFQSGGVVSTLGGRSVAVTDSAGVGRSAGLYLVSPQQVNFQIPPAAAPGAAVVALNGADGVAPVQITVGSIAPGLFSSALQIVRVHPDGSQAVQNITGPIVMGSDTLYLVLYGTGIRNHSSLANVRCVIGQQSFPVLYAGAQAQTPGLDQINVLLLPSLQGAGTVTATVVVDGLASNSATLRFQ
jgi:uncharacterized protein (TIGR03437 family)